MEVQVVEDEHEMHVVPTSAVEIALQSNDDLHPLVASKSLLYLPARHVEMVEQTLHKRFIITVQRFTKKKVKDRTNK